MLRSSPKSKSPGKSAGAPPSILARAALIIVAGALVYANSLSGPFVFDDQDSIVDNPSIRSLTTVLTERKNSPLAGRPVVGFTFALNYGFGGTSVTGYHLVNIALHIGCALLLFGIVRRTLTLPPFRQRYGGAAQGLALAVALLWLVHPLNTEAVNYLTQRTELLMALFYLLTLYCSIRSHASPHARRWQALAVLSSGVGMGCKESMVTAPLVVALYDRLLVFGSWRDAFRTRGRLYLGLALSWLVLTYLVLPGPRSGSAGLYVGVHPWTYLLNQAILIVHYLRLVFWPHGLAIHYGPPAAVSFGDALPALLLIVVMLGLTLAAFRWTPAIGFLGAWLFLTLAPTSSIIPIATEVGAERRMYVPLMAILVFLAVGAYSFDKIRRRVAPPAAASALAAAAIALGAATIMRNEDYKSPLVLARTTLAHWPTAYAHGVVGTELARAKRDDEAIPELRIGAAVDPRTRYNLGISLFNTRRYAEAVEELGTLVAEHPMREEVPLSRRIRGHAYALLGKWPEAIAELRMALAMRPADRETTRLLVDTLNKQGIELGSAGNHPKAVAAFRGAVDLDPEDASVGHNLATALLDSGDIDGALAEAQRTMARHPTDAGSYDLMGRALAMQGKLDEAIAQLEQARRLSPGDAAIREDLERVLAARRRR